MQKPAEAPPSLATEAVLVKSEAIPEGTPVVRGKIDLPILVLFI